MIGEISIDEDCKNIVSKKKDRQGERDIISWYGNVMFVGGYSESDKHSAMSRS